MFEFYFVYEILYDDFISEEMPSWFSIKILFVYAVNIYDLKQNDEFCYNILNYNKYKLKEIVCMKNDLLEVNDCDKSFFTEKPFITIERLKTESLKNPLGIDKKSPHFSWQMNDTETRGQFQKAYKIIVRNQNDDIVWNSGKILSDKSYGITYSGEPLEPSTRYFWNVTLWDKNDRAHTSEEEAWFETGLMEKNNFMNSEWISSQNEVANFDFEFNAEIRLNDGDCSNILFGRNNKGYEELFQWCAHPEGNNYFSWKIIIMNGQVHLCQQRHNGDADVDLMPEVNLSTANIISTAKARSGFDFKIKSENGYLKTYIDNTLAVSIWCPEARIDGFTIKQSVGCEAEYRNIRLTDDSGNVNYDGNIANDSYFAGCVTEDGWKRLNGEYYLPGGTTFKAEMTIRFDSTFSPAVTIAQILLGAKDMSNYFVWQVKCNGNSIGISPCYYRNGITRFSNVDPYFTVDMGEDIAASKAPLNIKIVSENGTATIYIDGKNIGSIYIGHIAAGSIGFRSFSRIWNIEFKDLKYTVGDTTKTAPQLFAAEELGAKNSEGYYKICGAYNAYVTIIGNNKNTPGGAAPMLRKEFSVASGKQIESARLYASATGIYEAYINGRRVDDSYLNPGRTRYTKRIMYQTFDVTNLVNSGENAIGVILGRGWWRGGNTAYEGPLSFTGKLLINYVDGSNDIIETDRNWSSFTDGPVRVNEIFSGEKYDARKLPGEWLCPGYNESKFGWSRATTITPIQLKLKNVVAQNGPLTKIYKILEPIAVNNVTTWDNAGVKVYDFGQNIAGIVRVKVKGRVGDTITLRFAELVNGPTKTGKTSVDITDADGALWVRGNRGAKQTDTYILNGNSSGETFETSFVYHGFRYMQLSGKDKASSIPKGLEILEVEAFVLCSELEKTGRFESSDNYINKYVENTRWSMIDNYLSVPTDCPQRDERYGWLADAQIFMRTSSYLADVDSFMSKFMVDCNDDFKDGLYPGAVLQFNPTAAIGGWTDGGIIIPWRLYQQYGNKNVMAENYDNMKAYIDHMIIEANTTGFTPLDNTIKNTSEYPGYIDKPPVVSSDCMYGDWFSYGEHTPYVITETAFMAYSTHLFSKMAELLGKKADAEKYSLEFEKYRKAWKRYFVNSDGSMKCDPEIFGTGMFGTAWSDDSTVKSQGAYVIGLRLGLFDDDVRPLAVKKLVELIKAADYSIHTGFLGVSYILPVLSEEGYSDVAYAMMENKKMPGYLWAVLNGATTTYERWDVYTETETTYKYTDHSLNHYAYGSATEWLYRYVLGIDTITDVTNDITAFKNIVLQPTIGGTLTYVDGSYMSIYGEIKSSWEKTDKGTVYRITVPANTTATIYLPKLNCDKTYFEGNVNALEAEGVNAADCEKEGKIAYNLASGSYIFSEVKQ